MYRTFNAILIAFAVLVTTTACTEAQQSPRNAAETPPVIQTLERQGLEVFGEFDAPGELRGYAGLGGQQPLAVYVTPDGEHAVVGTLINAQGENVSAEAIRRLVERPMTERTWKQLEQSDWVPDGDSNSPRTVYVFTDPNCPYCHRFWEASRPWVESGKVQLRHILVGVIKADSANKAAAILSADSPEAALTLNEQRFDEGGIRGVPVTQTLEATLDANERLMDKLGFRGTPGILFRDEDGLLQRRAGLPSPSDLPVVLGPR